MRIVVPALALIGASLLGSTAVSAQSFRATCSNVVQRGPFIEATCATPGGFPVRTAIDARQCFGRDIANVGGRLACGGGGGGFRSPPRDEEYVERRYRRPPPSRFDEDDDEDFRPRRRY